MTMKLVVNKAKSPTKPKPTDTILVAYNGAQDILLLVSALQEQHARLVMPGSEPLANDAATSNPPGYTQNQNPNLAKEVRSLAQALLVHARKVATLKELKVMAHGLGVPLDLYGWDKPRQPRAVAVPATTPVPATEEDS